MISTLTALIPTVDLSARANTHVRSADRGADQPRSTSQLFAGIAGWPDLDQILADRAVQIITAHGIGEFALRGGILRPDGWPGFGAPSSEAFQVLRNTITEHGRFTYRDSAGQNWAVLVKSNRSGSETNWLGLALGLYSTTTAILDADWRRSCAQALKARLTEQSGRIFRFDNSGNAKRSQLAIGIARVETAEAAMQLVPCLIAMAKFHDSHTLRVPFDDLATVLWGENQLYWPTDHQHVIFEAVSWLNLLQVQRLKLPKTGWCPEPQQRCSAVTSVRWVSDHELLVHLNPTFIAFINMWLRRCATESNRVVASQNT